MKIVADHRAEFRHVRHAELVRTLCSIVAELIDTPFDHPVCQQCAKPVHDEAQSNHSDVGALHDLSLPMILSEFKLTPKQVLMLRRRGGFPNPYRDRHRLMFRRIEVEAWIAEQPDRSRLAEILKRPMGSTIRRVGTQKCKQLIHFQ